MAAAQQIGYRPNRMAQGLVTGRSGTMGLLVSDIRNNFFSEIARGVEDAARKAGYNVVLCNSDLDPDRQMECIAAMLDTRVDGMVLNSVAALGGKQREELAKSRVPIVLLNREASHRTFCSVLADNHRGGYLAGEYLASLGHRHMAHFTGVKQHGNLTARCDGFLEGVRSVVPDANPSIFRDRHTSAGGYALAQELLNNNRDITAIFAANDAMAFGVMRAFRERGVRVAHDISLVGFDDVELASVVDPPLTTVRQPSYQMGRAAVEILMNQLAATKATPEHRIFDVELVVRDSCRTIGDAAAALRHPALTGA
jgi:LacI family transcriptional regulator